MCIRDSLTTALGDDVRHLLGGEGGGDLVLRLDPHRRDDALRQRAHQRDDMSQRSGDEGEYGDQKQRGALGPGDGEVLGDHLPDDDMAVDDDEQGQGQGQAIGPQGGQTQRGQGRRDEVVQRRLGAVSYTHLDVYKRQVPSGSSSSPVGPMSPATRAP